MAARCLRCGGVFDLAYDLRERFGQGEGFGLEKFKASRGKSLRAARLCWQCRSA